MFSFFADIRRLGLALNGKYRPSGTAPDGDSIWALQPDRKSGYKGYVGDITHAAKNVGVELLRDLGIWDRPSDPDGR